jgi:hypothetical protein
VFVKVGLEGGYLHPHVWWGCWRLRQPGRKGQ